MTLVVRDPNDPPDPRSDWVNQRQLVTMLGLCEKTGSLYASAGNFRPYEHGISGCGRRKYSRALVERALQRSWELAVRAQDARRDGE